MSTAEYQVMRGMKNNKSMFFCCYLFASVGAGFAGGFISVLIFAAVIAKIVVIALISRKE